MQYGGGKRLVDDEVGNEGLDSDDIVVFDDDRPCEVHDDLCVHRKQKQNTYT